MRDLKIMAFAGFYSCLILYNLNKDNYSKFLWIGLIIYWLCAFLYSIGKKQFIFVIHSWLQYLHEREKLTRIFRKYYYQRFVYGQFIYGFKNENKMSKDLEVLKADVKKLMLKDWTKTEVEKLSEFMEDVIIATMVVNKLPIHVVTKSF